MAHRLASGISVALFIMSFPASAEKAEPVSKTAAAVVLAEPRDIVAILYKRAAAEAKKEHPTNPFSDPATRQKYFSKGFDLLITTAETKAAHDGSRFIKFDPITASKDAEPTIATVKTELLELGKAVISASFTNVGKPTIVTFDFIKDDGAWAIDDIKGTTEKEAWSVRKILKGTGKEPAALPGMSDARTEKPTGE